MNKIECKNQYEYISLDGEPCVELVTNGKHKHKVLVDKDLWETYLCKFNWTACIPVKNYVRVRTSINRRTVVLARVIIEHVYDEVDYWGNAIDHVNNNSLDNRLSNLRIFSNKLNSTNIKSKYFETNMHHIFPNYNINSKGERCITGYKVQTNVFDESIYKAFKTLEEAIIHRDTIVIPYIEERIIAMIKKTRDIELERGLKNKLEHNELEEIKEIVEKYGYELYPKQNIHLIKEDTN